MTNTIVPRPPKHAPRYRRWREWYDFGEANHGHGGTETKWRAQSPKGDQVEAGSFAELRAEIDRREGATTAGE